MDTPTAEQNPGQGITNELLATMNARFAEMMATIQATQRNTPEPVAQPVVPDPPQGEGRRPNWKTADVGFFWPDIPTSMGTGRIVDYKNERYFRDVNAFVSRIRDTIPHYGAELMRNNLHNCLRGEAFAWYNDIIRNAMKNALRNDQSPDCQVWCESLQENFKTSGAQAMKEIVSTSTNYTVEMLKRGIPLTIWFAGMVSLATDAGFTHEDQKLAFIWNKMDAELQERLPQPSEQGTIEGYLQSLRVKEEPVREAFKEQDRRLATQLLGNQFRGTRGYGYNTANPYVNRRTPFNDTYQPRETRYQNNWQPREPQARESERQNDNTSTEIVRRDKPTAPAKDSGPPTQQNEDRLPKRPGWMSPMNRRPPWNGRAPQQGPGRLGQQDAVRFMADRRIAPRTPCRFCNGNHFDSMCRQRNLYTKAPRVFFAGEIEEVATFHVDITSDHEYDKEHQEFVNAFFGNGWNLQDYDTLAECCGDEDEYVDCGYRVSGETPHTEEPSIESEDEYTQEIFHIPTPKQVREPIKVEPAATKPDKKKKELRGLQTCEQCSRPFVSRNKLFAHLRTTNHFHPSQRTLFNRPIGEIDAGTPNDPAKEQSTEVIKSKSKMVPGTGYAFRDFNFLEVNVRLESEGKDELVCVDTGCGMSLVDEDWLEKRFPGATILNRASAVKVRGLGKEEHLTNKYLVLQLFLPEIGGTGRVAEIRREFHLVKGLGCKLLLGNDIIKPERWVIDVAEGKMTLRACEDMVCCNVRGRGSLSHYLVYSESPSRWCSLAIILLIYLHHNLLFVSNRSIQNTYRLVTLAVLTLLSLSCSLERFAFVYHVNISKTRYTVTPEFHHHVRNRENGHTWFDCTPENRV
jgi:hypothetical protein